MVSASTRPSFMPAMASLAIWIADMPALGTDAGMRLEPRHGEGEPVGHGGPRDELAHAVHVEDEAALRPEPARVEVLGPQEPRLLADAEDHLDVAVGDLLARGGPGSPRRWTRCPPCHRRPAPWCDRCARCRPRPRDGSSRRVPTVSMWAERRKGGASALVPGEAREMLPVSPPTFSPRRRPPRRRPCS